jgi:hypothetical protein
MGKKELDVNAAGVLRLKGLGHILPENILFSVSSASFVKEPSPLREKQDLSIFAIRIRRYLEQLKIQLMASLFTLLLINVRLMLLPFTDGFSF